MEGWPCIAADESRVAGVRVLGPLRGTPVGVPFGHLEAFNTHSTGVAKIQLQGGMLAAGKFAPYLPLKITNPFPHWSFPLDSFLGHLITLNGIFLPN